MLTIACTVLKLLSNYDNTIFLLRELESTVRPRCWRKARACRCRPSSSASEPGLGTSRLTLTTGIHKSTGTGRGDALNTLRRSLDRELSIGGVVLLQAWFVRLDVRSEAARIGNVVDLPVDTVGIGVAVASLYCAGLVTFLLTELRVSVLILDVVAEVEWLSTFYDVRLAIAGTVRSCSRVEVESLGSDTWLLAERRGLSQVPVGVVISTKCVLVSGFFGEPKSQ